jgi:hypothetical protein
MVITVTVHSADRSLARFVVKCTVIKSSFSIETTGLHGAFMGC